MVGDYFRQSVSRVLGGMDGRLRWVIFGQRARASRASVGVSWSLCRDKCSGSTSPRSSHEPLIRRALDEHSLRWRSISNSILTRQIRPIARAKAPLSSPERLQQHPRVHHHHTSPVNHSHPLATHRAPARSSAAHTTPRTTPSAAATRLAREHSQFPKAVLLRTMTMTTWMKT